VTDDGEIVLCCLLWARDGEASGLSAYEDRVLALVPNHGGEVIHRAVSNGVKGRPHEVQLYRFPNQTALDAYIADPARLALANDRDQAIARTELFPVSLR
jgi:hypothetical protein